jgi:apolipoprotein N-acyltransferase
MAFEGLRMSIDSRRIRAINRSPLEQTKPMPQTFLPPSNHPKAWTLVPALLTAGLLWLCYFPVDWGWLGWIALVPLLSLVRTTARPRRVYLSAWVAGLAFFVASLQWVRVADYRMYATWLSLALYCSFYFPLAIYLLRRLDRRTRLPLTITVPVVWTALELLRAHFLMGGFPWYFLGHSQHAFLPLIQVSDLAGAYAVTFLVAAVNGLVFDLLATQPWFQAQCAQTADAPPPGCATLGYQSVAVVLLVSGVLGYGAWRLSQDNFEAGPRLALLQGSVDQRLRNEATAPGANEDVIGQVRQNYLSLCDKAATEQADLIVWPETSFMFRWSEIDSNLPAERLPPEWVGEDDFRRRLTRDAAQRWGTNLLVGLSSYTLGADTRIRHGNSAILIQKDGAVGGRYDKIHCVPFGEYVPFRDWLPWLNKFAPYDYDYSLTPGDRLTRFPLDAYHFGVIICYEDTDPSLARQYVDPDSKEPPADFVLNISNDGWFDGTSEHEEHLAICRFRAVECRRAVARAVNMGISAVIDGNGRVCALPGRSWAESKKVEAVVTAHIPIDHRTSLYARWGDWLPWTCWLVVGGGLVGGVFWPVRRS